MKLGCFALYKEKLVETLTGHWPLTNLTRHPGWSTGYPVFSSDYGLPPMEAPTYSPRPLEPSPYSPAPVSAASAAAGPGSRPPGTEMVDLAPAAPWSCWPASDYQPPPPPAFASPVEAELALTGQPSSNGNGPYIFCLRQDYFFCYFCLKGGRP